MTLRLLVCAILGGVALVLLILQLVRGRRISSRHSTKRFVLGLFILPVLLFGVWLYLGQLQMIFEAA